MLLYLASAAGASLTCGLALLVFGFLARSAAFQPEAPWGARLARLFALSYLLAAILGLLARWTFARGPLDGALLGLYVWAAAQAVEMGGRLVYGARDFRRGAAAFWLAILPMLGALMVRLVLPPGRLAAQLP